MYSVVDFIVNLSCVEYLQIRSSSLCTYQSINTYGCYDKKTTFKFLLQDFDIFALLKESPIILLPGMDKSIHTLEIQINIRVQIKVQGENFAKNNKYMGPNKNTGYKKSFYSTLLAQT